MRKIEEQILALETAALDRWNTGDPDGYLDLYDEDITYFDPMQENRIDGHDKMAAFYQPARGNVSVTNYELIAPLVQVTGGDSAVLSYQLLTVSQLGEFRFNCSQVYSRKNGKWKIVHSHYAMAKPQG